MNGVQQSGNVTPGHLALWATVGVLQDGGPIGASQKVLAAFFSANFNAASADQALLLPFSISAFMLTGIIITNASVSLTTAAGGFYPGANQTGSPIVASSQAYSSLTNSNQLLQTTLTAYAQTARFSSNNLPLTLGPNSQEVLEIFFNLTTPQGAPATADIYLVGIDLSPPT